MINKSLVGKEVRRLFTLPFPPSTEEAKLALADEYTTVLRESVESKEHCAAVIDWLMRHSQRCPTPADVLAALEAVQAPSKSKAPMGCKACQFSGYISFMKLVKVPGMPEPYEADFAKPCSCELGRYYQPEYDAHGNKPIGAAQDIG